MYLFPVILAIFVLPIFGILLLRWRRQSMHDGLHGGITTAEAIVVLPRSVREEFEKTIIYTGEGELSDNAFLWLAQLRNNNKAERVLEVKSFNYHIESRPITEVFDVQYVPKNNCGDSNAFLVFRLPNEAEEFARLLRHDVLSMNPIEFRGDPPSILITT